MSDSPDEIPAFEDLAEDAGIAPLLDFEPEPRKIEVEGGWTPELQREFIARLAVHGSACKACNEMGKNRTGVTKLHNHPHGASFRVGWHGAVVSALLGLVRLALRHCLQEAVEALLPRHMDSIA